MAKEPSMLDIDDVTTIGTMNNYEKLAFAIILQAVKNFDGVQRIGRCVRIHKPSLDKYLARRRE